MSLASAAVDPRRGAARRDPVPPVSYVLPIRSATTVDELAPYLAWLRHHAQVIVVDGSAPEVFAAHDARWPDVDHVPVDDDLRTPMGKVGGVLTGLRRARHRAVIVADDDVRYDARSLAAMGQLLDGADVVVPQNHFLTLPWHARWDTARTLLARATGGDWPGTLGVDRDALRAVGGYRGDVMFENLELVRTVAAAGGTIRRAPELFVGRLPPSTAHFARQRVRQAYDELARPPRLVVSLSLLPLALVGGRKAVVGTAAAGVLLAEIGRRRDGGREVFPGTAALWAPLWIGERSITAWLALARHLTGGVPYGGVRLRTAATSVRALRRRARRLPCPGAG